VNQFSVRAASGPGGQRAPLSKPAELSRTFREFRDLLANRRGLPPQVAESAGPVAFPKSEGRTPRPELGAEGPDVRDPRRNSDDPGVPAEPDLPVLEPFGVLLGSFGGFEARAPELSPAASVPERLVSDVVRSLAWGGNQRRGAAKLELGGERYGGTRLVVEVDGDRLRLQVDAPPGVDSEELRARLAERFARRGLSLSDD